ncbi:MAG: hypothetical protein QOF76_5087 [Solirubrobacteraceae bacterium]|jgi:hypothetical protein|nr:hypothetical protein [Solirubrobacteraceae bacterium]
MHGPLRLLAALAAACAFGIFAAPASAYVTHDISNITLTESFSNIGSSAYHVSSGTDGGVAFRWLDAPGKDTVIRAVNCDGSTEYGRHTFSAGSIDFATLFSAGTNTCFQLQAKTVSGQGVMANPHNARVRH